MLLTIRAVVDLKNNDGATALVCASDSDQKGAVRALLAACGRGSG